MFQLTLKPKLTFATVLVFGYCVGYSSAAFAQNEIVSNEYIVKYKPSTTAQKMMSKLSHKVHLKASLENGLLHIEDKMKDGQVVQELKQDPEVEFIEPNYIMNAIPIEGGSNSAFSKEQALEMIEDRMQAMGAVSSQSVQYYSQSLAPIQMEQAWSVMKDVDSAPKTIVAVIDTGLDHTHAFFNAAQAIWVNQAEIPNNGIDDDFNGYVDDVSGWNFVTSTNNYYDDSKHGTHVSGIIVGVGIDMFATTTQRSKVKIMPLKFLDNKGAGTTANAIKAIYYAVGNGAKVINNSWGGPTYSKALVEAMKYAYDRGVVLVSAAGNAGTDNDAQPMYPASYDVPSNISVMATDDYDQKPGFSNFGANSVSVAAPGVAVWSTIPGGHDFLSGTSMAAPLVAGLAAHALREAPNLSGYQIKSIIMGQTNKFSNLNYANNTSGRVNALKIINEAIAKKGLAAYQPDYTVAAYQERDLASESTSSGGSAGGCGTVAVLAKGLANGGGSGPTNPWTGVIVGLLMLAPLMIWLQIRQAAKNTESSDDGRNRRKFQRYELQTSVDVQIGGVTHKAQTASISLGGLSLNSDQDIEKDQMVVLRLKGANGEDIELKGKVVWSTETHSYGVQFSEESEALRESLKNMEGSLKPI